MGCGLIVYPLGFRYEKSSRRGSMGYEDTFYRFLQGIMSDVERRIRRGHERLALNAKKEQVIRFLLYCHSYFAYRVRVVGSLALNFIGKIIRDLHSVLSNLENHIFSLQFFLSIQLLQLSVIGTLRN